MASGLSALQSRVLELLADITPRWTLSGGGALAGFHLRHRTTRDLDLFWHGAREIQRARDAVELRLSNSGLGVRALVASPGFCRLEVGDSREKVVLDLVAEPVPYVDPPQELTIGSARIQVDSPHEILVNKLCTLLSRQEIRDLQDVSRLVGAGGDLWRAVSEADRKDGGFSPQMLAWLLRSFPVRGLAEREKLPPAEVGQLEAFRDQLVEELLRRCNPKE